VVVAYLLLLPVEGVEGVVAFRNPWEGVSYLNEA